MNLAIVKFLMLINLLLPGAIPQGFIYSGTPAETIAYVSGANGYANSTGNALTYSPTSGNWLKFYIVTQLSSGSCTVSDNGTSGGSTYTSEIHDTSSVSGWTQYEFHAVAVSGVTTITPNCGSSALNADAVLEFSGASAHSSDGVSSAATGTGTTFTANGVTTTFATSLIDGFFFNSTSGQGVTATGSFIKVQEDGFNGNALTLTPMYRLVSTTGTYNAQGTVGSSATWTGYSARSH